MENNMKDVDSQIELLENRNEWRRRIHVDNYLN